MKTKERILVESMKLFSVSGYDAVSIRAIADAVEIGNSALYKHFSSKQSIFDAIIEESKQRYIKECNRIVTEDIRGVEAVKNVCINMFTYQTTDEWIVMFRRILLLEKFRNEKIPSIYKEFFVDLPIKNQMRIFEELMDKGLMTKGNSEVFAIELYSPFYLYHFVERDQKELKELFMEHVDNFFKEHFIPKVK